MDIRHVVVLMLENRSFDGMLGRLHPKSAAFDGLAGTESNIWHETGGSQQEIPVWNDAALAAGTRCIPDPDPGELFTDIEMQVHGLTASAGTAPMSGFVDNYMRQPATSPLPDPRAVMHYFTPEQVPVISRLAREFGVCDRWHASAPCQTWPNRFFVHAGTADGYVNNSPPHLYRMETVFNRLETVKQEWRIYFHDIPQAAALARLWGRALTNFRGYETDFARDAAAGALPAYSFIEPRYFADTLGGKMPNDEHPPHDVGYGEALIASVYNAVRGGSGWKETLLMILWDEHGGCFDHVPPPRATPPDGFKPDGFDFGAFGVRVPAVIVSPYVRAGSVIRPSDVLPFDHTSIIATLRKLFGFASLTARDAAAPDLLQALGTTPDNDGPASIAAPSVPTERADVEREAMKPPNGMQRSLSAAAVQLPTAGANIGAHIERLASVPDAVPSHATVADAAGAIAAHMKAFLGGL